MAEILDTFDWSSVPKGNSRARLPKDSWLDGRVWELSRGADFQGKAVGVLTNLRVKAKKEGKEVRAVIRGTDDTGVVLTLQAFWTGGLPIEPGQTSAPAADATAEASAEDTSAA